MSSALPLERKLPLLMTGVIVALLAMSLVLTYGTLARSAEQATRQRLASAAQQVAGSAGAAAADRATRMREVAGDSAIRRLLERPVAESAQGTDAARAALARLYSRPPSASSPAAELWDARGRRIAFVGRDLPFDSAARTGHPVPRERLVAPPAPDSIVFGTMYAADSAVFYWVVAPVMANGEARGYLAYQARISSPSGAAQSLRDLTGEDVTMILRTPDDRFWAVAPGDSVAPPARRDSVESILFYTRSSAGRMIAAELPVPGIPMVVVLEAPLASVRARVRGTMLRLAALGLLLTIAGAAISSVISRRIARPIASLTVAAEAIAQGDYARRVDARGTDEVGRLAASFNRMASEVDATRQELEQQVEEAQATAEELEQANEQLQDAIAEAEIARDEAEHAREDAQRANRAKSDFLAVMSHELRTPLNAIGGYAQLMELEIHGPVTDAQRDALARIARSQSHLLRLINDVLNFARIDAGQLQYEMSDVALDEALAGLEPLVAPQIRARKLQFIYRPCTPQLTVWADRDKLQQIVLNLLTNAIKFTPEGGAVTVDCASDETEVRIRVRDTGVGIPPERLRMIFDPFVQLDRTLNTANEGVGLGLSISRDLARGMEGDLSVESGRSEGSVFTLTLKRGSGERAAVSVQERTSTI